jgi:hypothetical protein
LSGLAGPRIAGTTGGRLAEETMAPGNGTSAAGRLFDAMFQWIQDHPALFTWLMAASLAVFVASLLVVPAVIVRIPADYFTRDERPRGAWDHWPSPVRYALLIAKNALGIVFIVAGFAMLVLPGQGLLTLLIGFLMLDFPGKYRVEKRLFSLPSVRRATDWVRKRAGREPLAVQGRSARST